MKTEQTTKTPIQFLNISSVKKLVRSAERQASPDFFTELDAFVSAKVRKCCEQGGTKRLGQTDISATVAKVEVQKDDVKKCLDELWLDVCCLRLQLNVLTKEEFIKRLDNVKRCVKRLREPEVK